MKRLFVFIFIAVLAIGAFGFAGCSFVREGITGERQTDPAADGSTDEEEYRVVPAAFNIIGDWFGVYNGSEYLSLRFTANGKCELQPAVYPSDIFGPRYYGDYRWGGDDGREIILDMYKGVSREVDYGEGNIWDDWTDGGREGASTALYITFRGLGGQSRSVAIKTDMGGIDTDGYQVVHSGAFAVLMPEAFGGSGNQSPFIFGATPYDQTEGKTLAPSPPDSFIDRAERFYTTAELNVRCGPSTSFGTYGTVPLGTPADKIGYMFTGHDDWAFALLMEGGGWMNTEYLSSSPPAPETSTNQQ